MTAPRELVDRLPPHSREAEMAVLGGILRDPEVLPVVQFGLRAEDFYFDSHRKVFQALEALAGDGKPLDLVSLHARLREAKHLEDVGGHQYLAELYDAVPTGANAEYHAKLVRDEAAVRAVIHAANEVLRDAYDRTGPTEELVARFERMASVLSDSTAPRGGTLRPLSEILSASLQRIDDRIGRGGGLDGLPTGYPDLDDALGGMRPGQMVVVAARPSIGKTAIALNILGNLALDRVAVALFSAEMPDAEIGGRVLSMGSGVPMHKLSRGLKLSPEDADRLIRAAGSDGFGGTPFWIDDTPSQPAVRIAAITRRAVRRLGVKLVAVDYLQLLDAENLKDNRTQQVGLAARRLKRMARECGIPVLCLCQLNREVENRGGSGKPKLSDLRESGEIEQHADTVVLLHPDPDRKPDAEVWSVTAIVAKNRNGPVGEVELAFRRPVMLYENAAKGI